MARAEFSDEAVQQAWGRVLNDRTHPGDGKLLLASLESVLRGVSYVGSNPCALQESNGQRILAARLIHYAEKANEQSEDAGSTSNIDASTGERRNAASSGRAARRSRRRIAGSAGPDA